MTLRGEHECARFWANGLDCPFGDEQLDDDDDDTEEGERDVRDLALPARKRNSRSQSQRMGQLNNILTIAHSQEEMREKLKVIEGERIAAIVPGGEALLQRLLESGLNLSGNRLFQASAMAALAAAFFRLRGTGLMKGLPTVRSLERPVTKGLGKLSGGSGITTQQGTGGRGGFHVDAAAEIKALFGDRARRRVEEKFGRGGQGFFFPGEPT